MHERPRLLCSPLKFGKDAMSTNTRPAQDQLLASVQTAKNRLHYLSHNDWMLLVDRAKQVAFKKGDAFMQQGSHSKTLYIIAAGNETRRTPGAALAQIGPGALSGETEFVAHSRPSATATAE